MGTGGQQLGEVKGETAIPDKRWLCPIMAMAVALTGVLGTLYSPDRAVLPCPSDLILFGKE